MGNIVSVLQADTIASSAGVEGGYASQIGSGSVSFGWVNWLIIGVYLFAIFCIGIYFSLEVKFKKHYVRTSQDYFTASRSIPGWAAGFSLFATSLSAITFLSVPSQTFNTDWIIMIGAIIAPAFAPFLIKFVVPFFRKLKAESAYDYIHKRFGLHMRLFISTTFILYQAVRAAVVVYLPTIAISTVLPQVNEYVIAVVVVIITIAYTYIGGIKSIIWADFVQGVLLTVAILVMIFWSMGLINQYSDLGNSATSGTGGFAQSAYTTYEDGKYLANGHWTVTLTGIGIPVVFMSYFVNAVYPVVGGQDVVQRYQSAKTKHDMNYSIVFNAFLSVIVGILMFYGFGTLLYQLFSGSNQVAYTVTSFKYGDYTINTIWVAYNTAANGTYSNMWGLISQSQGWVALTGPSQLFSGYDWSQVTLQMIKENSMLCSSQAGNGSVVTVSSVVSSFSSYDSSAGIVSNSNVVPYFIATVLPVGVSGFIIAGILAAGQSSTSSCLNSASCCFVNDIVRLYYPNLSNRTNVVIGQLAVLVTGIFSLLVVLLLVATEQDSIFLFFNSIVGLFGATVLAIFFMGMFDNYVRNRAAIIGIWTGTIVAIITFLLSYSSFMDLFHKSVLLNNTWVAVFSFLTTYVVAYLAQFIENLIRYARKPALIGYEKLTYLGKKLHADKKMIERWARFDMAGLLATKCSFDTHSTDNFNYVKIDKGRITLNKLGSKLFNEKKLTEKQIIWLNRFGWAWFYIKSDTPRDDLSYWKRIENLTLKNLTNQEILMYFGEESWNWDVLAYRRYVKNVYRTKYRAKSISQLEEKQMLFKEFQEKTTYDRYLLHTNIKNWFRTKKYKRAILSPEQVFLAQKEFLERDKW